VTMTTDDETMTGMDDNGDTLTRSVNDVVYIKKEHSSIFILIGTFRTLSCVAVSASLDGSGVFPPVAERERCLIKGLRCTGTLAHKTSSSFRLDWYTEYVRCIASMLESFSNCF